MQPHLRLVHFYPTLLNLYGDRGNIITLQRRCQWRGVSMEIHRVGLEEPQDLDGADLIFMGGDQDREQAVVVDDLRRHHLHQMTSAIERGVPVLAVCGSYQLFQRYYRPAEGADLIGLGVFDAHTEHPGHDIERCVGNIVVDSDAGTIVGFENHGGRTFLSGDTNPLGRVIQGHGNNGRDGTEGARVANVFGTYVHGSLLPKNPRFADLLLDLALQRRYPGYKLRALDDALERQAHAVARARANELSR